MISSNKRLEFITRSDREARLCCFPGRVSPTCRDVYRIARGYQLCPTVFLSYRECLGPVDRTFRLSPVGRRCEMLLARRPMADPEESPCLFLLRTNAGDPVCGLGDLRPRRANRGGAHRPAYFAPSFATTARPVRGTIVAEEEEHRALLLEWNRRVVDGERERSFGEFCAFILNGVASRGGE